MKKLVSLSLFALFTALFSISTYASSARLIIDNREILELPSPPVIQNDRVLVPARAVFEEMGGVVGWHANNRQVTVFHGDNVLVMTIGSRSATLNGQQINMPVSPSIINDSTMIPLRFPAEAFGFDVDWDPTENAAIVNSPINGESEEPPVEEPPTQEPPVQNPPVQNPPSGSVNDDNQGLARNISPTPLVPASHSRTNITQILTPADTGWLSYVVQASSPISTVNYFILPDNRLVLDISNATNMVAGAISAYSPVSAVRVAQFSNSPLVTRVVLEINSAAEFTLSFSAERTSLIISFDTDFVPEEPEPPQIPQPPQVPQLPEGQFIVVIDPGHGGTDPGAIHNGIIERDLVLNISRQVEQLFEHNPYITVFMTRDGNQSVTLLERAEFANALGADLFVSIHANAAQYRSGAINVAANGIETWYNFGELEREAENNFTSRQFAEMVQRNMISRTGAVNRGLWYGNMIVLVETQMPSVLLELGFLTNPAEAQRLANSQYQLALAHAIYDAIVEAFNRFS